MSEVKHEVLLQAKGIYKNFETSKKDQAVHALTNVDLTLYRGETLALVGESGCGKSTLGRTLIRMLPATRGSVTFEGQNITAMKDKEFAPLRRRRCGISLPNRWKPIMYAKPKPKPPTACWN